MTTKSTARRSVEPYEAQGMSPDLTAEGSAAIDDLLTATNGFYYPGDRSSAILSAVAWLQVHPEACEALFGATAKAGP